MPQISAEKFHAYEQAITNNQEFLSTIVQYYSSSDLWNNDLNELQLITDEINPFDQKRNDAILHSAYREWSSQGADERNKSFFPILTSLGKFLPVTLANAFRQRVLVPGCGLARLPVEIAAKGYACEGNEFSAYMVMTSHFMLNGITKAGDFAVHPWIDRY